MEYHSREIKAGVLVLAGFLTLAVFLITITGIEWEKKEKHYTARFGHIGGIEPGSKVRFGGFLVGAVTDMYISADDNTKLEIMLTVDARTPVRKNSQAFISSIGLMGEYYIELTSGTQDEDMLSSGKRIPSRDVPSLTQLSEPFMDVSEQLALLLVRANDLLNGKNRENIADLLSNAGSFFNDNRGEVSGILQNLNSLTSQMQSITDNLDKMINNNSHTLEATLIHLNGTFSKTDSLLDAFRKTAETLNNMAMSNETNFYETAQNFETVSQNLEQFSRTIKEKPWLLVRKSAPPQRKLP